MNSLKYALALGVCFSALYAAMPHKANAQTAVGTGISNSESNSGSASRATSTNQGVRTNTGVNTGVTLNQNSYGSAIPNTSYQQNQNNGDVTVRTTPTVYAPPVSGGNPCTLAVSGAVSVIGWGAAAGGTFVDEDCANRQKIAMVHNAGYSAEAREMMCDDKKFYAAAKTVGRPCAVRTQFEPPPAQAAPLPPARPAGAPVAVPSQPMVIAAPVQPGRMVCLNMAGREVPQGTPGASCGLVN